jgi:hypothetical protein
MKLSSRDEIDHMDEIWQPWLNLPLGKPLGKV